jgi:uncharacterized protein with PIN domain
MDSKTDSLPFAAPSPVGSGSNQASFRFYEELNDFLPAGRRKQTIPYRFDGRPGIKDPIEALGVPHSEIELIVVNGESVAFDYPLKDGDRVAVYPCFEALDVSSVARLRKAPLRVTAFVLDVHLGKLARLLRMLGFDALYRNDYEDPEIVRIAIAQQRIILTRDRGLLFHRAVTHGIYVRSADPMQQAAEVVRRFDLAGAIQPFRRCMACNGLIEPVQKAAIEHELQPLTRVYHDDFSRCLDCGRIYWKGSHYDRLVERLQQLAG